MAALLLLYAVPHEEKLVVGQPMPNFVLPAESGGELSLESLRGQVVLLNFWATTCGTCAEEMPALNALHTKYQDRGFQVLGMNEDGPVDYAQKALAKYRQRIPLEFPQVFDEFGEVADTYGTFAIPESYLIDRNGNLLLKIVGSVELVEEHVVALIEQNL